MAQLRRYNRIYKGDNQVLSYKADYINDIEHFNSMDVRWYLAITKRHLPSIIKSNYEGNVVFEDGQIKVHLSPFDTEKLLDDVYYYEIEASEDIDHIITREVGKIYVHDTLTG